MVSFHNLGALLGRLAPRCSDPLPAIRTAAVDCIYCLLYIQLRYEGTETETQSETHRHRDTQTQRHKDTETHRVRHRDTLRDTE